MKMITYTMGRIQVKKGRFAAPQANFVLSVFLPTYAPKLEGSSRSLPHWEAGLVLLKALLECFRRRAELGKGVEELSGGALGAVRV